MLALQSQSLNFTAKQTKLLKLKASAFVNEAGRGKAFMNNIKSRIRDQRGFNLIELMIVIAIIGLLIGVGSVAWQAVIRSGNETTAAQSVDNIRKFQAQYASRNKGNFATFDELIERVSLDEKFAGERPVVNGYVFTMNVVPGSTANPPSYSINADPQVSEGLSATGTRHFYTDSSLSSIKGTDENRPAKADDPAI
jgi:prepilin-type N-terminal cleavage/methylation domain-containing protein